jgi:putative membrane protein
MNDMYLWIKVVHVLAVIAWMAGMLYLPRLFVYHAQVEPGSQLAETFAVMEKRLMRLIMLPAILVTWAAGLALAVEGHWFSSPWLHGKLFLVILMSVLHGYFGPLRRSLAEGKNTHSPRYFKVLNEVPTVLLIGIVILVIVKPF